MQVAEVVAQVLLQAQTDVLVEVAGDPSSPQQGVDSAVAQVCNCLLAMCILSIVPACTQKQSLCCITLIEQLIGCYITAVACDSKHALLGAPG